MACEGLIPFTCIATVSYWKCRLCPLAVYEGIKSTHTAHAQKGPVQRLEICHKQSAPSPSAILTMLGALGRCCSGALQALKPGFSSLKTIPGRNAALYSSKKSLKLWPTVSIMCRLLLQPVDANPAEQACTIKAPF